MFKKPFKRGIQYPSLVTVALHAFISAFTSTGYAADDENTIFVKGQFRLRSEANHQTDFSGDRDFSLVRVRPIIQFTKDSALDVVFTPQFSRTMGEPNYIPSVNTGTNTKAVLSGNTVDPSFNVHEGYVNYHPVDWFSFKGGRQVLTYGDELIIGALDWNNVARSFDAFKTRFTFNGGWSDLFASKILDNNTVVTGPGDINFYGFYNSFDLGEPLKALDVYALYLSDHSTSSATQLGAIGVRVASKINGLDYRAEYVKELGNALADASNASQLDAEAGFTLKDVSFKPRLGAGYSTSGSSYNQLYPSFHRWLGYADILGRRNISGFVIHGSLQPTESVTAKIDFHSFTRTSSSAPVYKLNGVTALGSAAGSTSNNIGNELDFTLSYQVTQYLNFNGGASFFTSGTYLTDQFGTLNPTFYYAQMEVKL